MGNLLQVWPDMDKKDIAHVLDQIGTMLEIKGENPFKVRAYFAGARALETLEEDLETVITEERLPDIRGIGKALTEKIATLHLTGELEFFENLKDSVPDGLLEMLEIPGLGGKKIKVLHEKLGIESIASLTAACNEGRVAELKGFGNKTQDNILSGIQNREAYAARHLWWNAQDVAAGILPGLRALPQVERAEAAGSLRRGMETVGDLDFLAASADPLPIMDWFTSQAGIVEVTAKGETKSSVRFDGGMQADLRVVPMEQFFFALHHFTGSKNHNVQMRQRALSMGLSLSEWGLKPEHEKDLLREGASITANCEEDIFKALGLQFIPPSLREGNGEIEIAENSGLPELVVLEDLKGCFHNHTTASDGRNTLEEMVGEAESRCWEYVGIADHSKSSFQANGLDAERLARQVEDIHRLNASGKYNTWVFTGTECDILSGGKLDFEDSLLATLDYVVASVHAGLTQDEDTMTSRLVSALEHPRVTMLGHPSGRLLLKREASRVNVEKVIDAAIANGKIIELNANPMRLDLDWRYWRRAAEKGLLCVINPDAHSTGGFDFLEAGVNIARKGWLEPGNILNTRSLDSVREFLKSTNP